MYLFAFDLIFAKIQKLLKNKISTTPKSTPCLKHEFETLKKLFIAIPSGL